VLTTPFGCLDTVVHRAAPKARTLALIAVLHALMAAVPAVAQDDTNARFHAGPVSLTPTFTVTNFGFDSNVFNDSIAPRSDITVTLLPAIDTSVRLGRARLSWSGRGDATFFKRYSDQNTTGTVNNVKLDVPLNRIRFSLSESYVNARERPTLDIDTRVRRRENAVDVSADVQLTALTHVAVSANLGGVSFDRGAAVGGVALGYVLDHSGTRFGVSLQRSLTPLTAVVGSVETQYQNFSGDSTRNNVTRRAALGLSFKPLALITGRFDVGILDFQPKGSGLQRTTAPAVSADLGYTLLGSTHFAVRMDRVVSYSLDETAAYSLQTGVGASVSHHFRESFDVGASAGRQALAYQVTPTAGGNGLVAGSSAPMTVVSVYDATFGYRVAGIHWGVHASYMERVPSGGAAVLPFRGFRTFASASYGSKF
jgi:hypothetical protein